VKISLADDSTCNSLLIRVTNFLFKCCYDFCAGMESSFKKYSI